MKSIFALAAAILLLFSVSVTATGNNNNNNNNNGGNGGGDGGSGSGGGSGVPPSNITGTGGLCPINYLTQDSFVGAANADFDEFATVTIPANPGRNVFFPPDNEDLIYTWTKDNLNAEYIEGSKTNFTFLISAGDAVGVSAIAQVSYDFDGDGNYDRNERFPLFATNPIPEDFEVWEGSLNETDSDSSDIEGDYKDLEGGSIRLRVWSGFGNGSLFLRIGEGNNETEVSKITFPFAFACENETGETNETEETATEGPGGTGGGIGGDDECCEEISSIRSELDALAERVDILHSRLLNVTQNCCEGVATATGSVGGTDIETGLAETAETFTLPGDATGVETFTVDA